MYDSYSRGCCSSGTHHNQHDGLSTLDAAHGTLHACHGVIEHCYDRRECFQDYCVFGKYHRHTVWLTADLCYVQVTSEGHYGPAAGRQLVCIGVSDLISSSRFSRATIGQGVV